MAIAEVMSKTKQMTEVERLSAKLAEAKRNVSRLERAIEVAKRKEKEAQETERARKIIALLEANKGKRIIIEDNLPFGEPSVALAEEIEVNSTSNKEWIIDCPKQKWGVCLEYVERVFVEAEI